MIDERKLIEDIEQEFVGVCVYDVSPSQAVTDFIEIVDRQPIIDRQPKFGAWIPCSERLPDKNGSYLVSFKEAITNSDGLCVKYWSGEEQRWRPCNYAPSVCWRAWMPLPEPYKVGDQE